MKKRLMAIISTLLVLLSATFVCGCKKEPSVEPEPEKVYYTVTFIEEGEENVIRKVEKDTALTDVPTPKPRTGYTVAWDKTDLSRITSDITVTAIFTPNKYVITYDANGGTVEKSSQEVTFDAEYTLLIPQREGFVFNAWTGKNGAVAASGIWKFAENVELTALWTESLPELCTVTFVQNGCEPIVKTVKYGESLTDIPEPASRKGYKVRWDVTDFTEIKGNMTVTAIEEAIEYKIKYDAAGGTVESSEQTVKYGETFELYIPVYKGFIFKGWRIKDSQKPFTNGTWGRTSDVELVATWEEDMSSDDNYTERY